MLCHTKDLEETNSCIVSTPENIPQFQLSSISCPGNVETTALKLHTSLLYCIGVDYHFMKYKTNHFITYSSSKVRYFCMELKQHSLVELCRILLKVRRCAEPVEPEFRHVRQTFLVVSITIGDNEDAATRFTYHRAAHGRASGLLEC